MTTHHRPDAERKPGDRTKSDDAGAPSPDIAKKLLADSQGRLLGGADAQVLAKLVKDGVLPAGAAVLDFGAVSAGLKKDKEEQKRTTGDAPADTTHFTSDLKTAQESKRISQQKLDEDQKAIDADQKKIDDRTHADDQAQKDLVTVTAALHKAYAYKTDLKTLSQDSSQPPDVKAAAQRLLDTYHHVSRGRYDASDYSANGVFGAYIDQGSLDNAKKLHQDQSAQEMKNMQPKLAARDADKAINDSAGKKVDSISSELERVNQLNDQQKQKQTKLADRIKDEEQALSPNAKVADLGKVVKGGGYYQVAEQLLGLDKKKHSVDEEKELKLLTKMLQEETKKLHGGQLPKYLTTHDVLLRPDNIAQVFEKLNGMTGQS